MTAMVGISPRNPSPGVDLSLLCIIFSRILAQWEGPIVGAMCTKYGGFEAVGLYCGGVIVIGCILLAITRHLALGKWAGKF